MVQWYTIVVSAAPLHCLHCACVSISLVHPVLDETPDLSNLLFRCQWLELWMSRAVCRMNDGAEVTVRWDQWGSPTILQVTSPCRSQLCGMKNNDLCHQSAVHRLTTLVYGCPGFGSTPYSMSSISAHIISFCNFMQKYIWWNLFW